MFRSAHLSYSLPLRIASILRENLVALCVLSLALALTLGTFAAGHRRIARTIWATALILVTVPFTDLHFHAHWYKVAWIPFVTPPYKLTDIIANVIIYVPFGFFARVSGGWMATIIRTAVPTVGFSFTMEVTQLFSHTRFPSATDVVCNVIGAVWGAIVRRAISPVR